VAAWHQALTAEAGYPSTVARDPVDRKGAEATWSNFWRLYASVNQPHLIAHWYNQNCQLYSLDNILLWCKYVSI